MEAAFVLLGDLILRVLHMFFTVMQIERSECIFEALLFFTMFIRKYYNVKHLLLFQVLACIMASIMKSMETNSSKIDGRKDWAVLWL